MTTYSAITRYSRLLNSVTAHPVFSGFFWYGYLLLLFFVSVVTKSIDSPAWLLLGSILFAHAALYSLAVLSGARCHWQAISEAKWVIFLLMAGIVWLALQTLLPSSHKGLEHLLPTVAAPEWYRPYRLISITPIRTQWLLFSSVLVLVWFVLSLALVDSRRRVKQLLLVLLLIGCIHAAVGVLAMVSDVYLVDRSKLDGHFRAARAWFVNRNHYAAFLNLSLIGCLAVAFRSGLNKDEFATARFIDFVMSARILYFAGGLLVFGASIMSQSRGGLASLLLALMIVLTFGVIYSHKFRDTLRANTRLLLLPLLLLTFLLLYFGQELLLRLDSESLSLGERVTQWQITWQAISSAWFVGYGGGSYGAVFQIYRELSDLRQVYFNQSHNDYLHIWLEQGILGLGIWLSVIYLSIKRAFDNAINTNSKLIRSTSLAALIVVGAALLQSGVGFNLQIINIRCYFFVIIALIHVLPSINRNRY